jgi:hypothetical protein
VDKVVDNVYKLDYTLYVALDWPCRYKNNARLLQEEPGVAKSKESDIEEVVNP